MWRPNDATVRLPDAAGGQGGLRQCPGDGDAHGVQIKMHPDKLVLRRDPDEAVGWTGIVADHHEVRVRVAGAWVLVGADKSVRRQLDGSFTRLGPEARINVSGGGTRLIRITEGWTHAIEGEGVIWRPERVRDRAFASLPCPTLPFAGSTRG